MLELLKRLMNVPSVSGREDKIREAIVREVEPYADEISCDPVGNLIVRKKGTGKKIMFCAHMDEIGFFATYIDDEGLIKVNAIGGISALAAAYTEVVSENGVRGVIIPECGKEMPKVENMYIDIGAKTKKQAQRRVKVGDFFVCAPSIRRLSGTRYVGRPFDDRVGCAIMIEALKKVKETENDLYFVFSTQEEVGARGSKPASYSVAPDIGIAIDVTGTGDKPGSAKMAVKLGGGCTVKIKDSGVICSPELVKQMREIAEENKVKYQNEVLIYGGTDASSIQVAGKGARVSAISVPTAFIHTGVEMVDMFDVNEAVKLTALLAEKL
ncbi:MAG: M20/M25/M40 family metallo-hydrolase [Clostridia bacterium]|nr:M20/M25/M40 family metallo-hydrolase [Clostridia bacterium]